MNRNIKVNKEFDRGHVKTTCKHICCDHNLDLPSAEFLNIFVSFFIAHFLKNYRGFISILTKKVEQYFSILFIINEYEGLSLRLHNIECLLNTINFLLRFTLVVILPQIFMDKLIRIKGDLNSFLNQVKNLLKNNFVIGISQEDILNLMVELLKGIVEFEDLVLSLLIHEKLIYII